MTCSGIEWGAVSAAVAVLIFAGGFFGKIIWSHGIMITKAHERVGDVEGRVTKIETTQADCQKQLADRLLKGDRSFEAITNEIKALSNTAERLTETAKNLSVMVDKMEERLWDGHERRGG